MANLQVEMCGISFRNPIVIASATPSMDAATMKRMVDAGCGGIISKTVTFEPLLHHYVSPRFTVLHKKGWPHCFSNYSCEFLAQHEPEEWMDEMKETAEYCDKYGVGLIGSISGDTLENWGKLARMMSETGVKGIELNFGCPHPRDLGYKSGQELGADPEAAAAVTKVVCENTKLPVGVKVTAAAVNPLVTSEGVLKAGASYLCVVNRFPALEIDMTGKPILHSSFAGVGGPWMRPIMLQWVAKHRQKFPNVPISATNGIYNWDDVIKAIMCGASTTQVCTSLMYSPKGTAMIKEYTDNMAKFMDENGYATIEDMRNITIPQLLTWDKVDRETKCLSVVDPEKCTGCEMCKNWCFRGPAMTYSVVNGKKVASIDPTKCDGCGLCPSLCPAGAITLTGKTAAALGNFR